MLCYCAANLTRCPPYTDCWQHSRRCKQTATKHSSKVTDLNGPAHVQTARELKLVLEALGKRILSAEVHSAVKCAVAHAIEPFARSLARIEQQQTVNLEAPSPSSGGDSDTDEESDLPSSPELEALTLQPLPDLPRVAVMLSPASMEGNELSLDAALEAHAQKQRGDGDEGSLLSPTSTSSAGEKLKGGRTRKASELRRKVRRVLFHHRDKHRLIRETGLNSAPTSRSTLVARYVALAAPLSNQRLITDVADPGRLEQPRDGASARRGRAHDADHPRRAHAASLAWRPRPAWRSSPRHGHRHRCAFLAFTLTTAIELAHSHFSPSHPRISILVIKRHPYAIPYSLTPPPLVHVPSLATTIHPVACLF